MIEIFCNIYSDICTLPVSDVLELRAYLFGSFLKT